MGQDPGTVSDGRAVPAGGLSRPVLRDLLMAVTATGASLLVMFASGEPTAREPDALGVALLALAGCSLSTRRRWPTAVLLWVVGVTAGVLMLDYPGGAELPLVMAALYTATAEGRRLVALAVLGFVMASSVGYRLVVEQDDPVLVVITVALLVLVVLLGEAMRARRELREEVRERLRIMAAETELETRARLTSERLRIARELHDVLAHTITAITVQAGAAADGLDVDGPARNSLRSMRATAREAMQQLQATIEVLRSEHDDGPALAAPGLANLPQLVQGVEETGLKVETAVEGDVLALPAAVELTAYRIVQEALTNVIRHADADGVQVAVRYRPDVLTVQILDDGPGVPGGTGGRGYGILGMRERAQALGGHLEAGPADAGGFRVEATLPIGDGEP